MRRAVEVHAAALALVDDQLGAARGEERVGEQLGVAAGVGLAQEQRDVQAVNGVGGVGVASGPLLGREQQFPVGVERLEHRFAEGDQALIGRGARTERRSAADQGFLEVALAL